MSFLLSKPTLLTVGLVANSVVIGAPVWVFFVQAPVLLSFMGRDKFLPPMMRLTKLLFRWTLPGAAGVVLLVDVLAGLVTNDGGRLLSMKNSTKFASISLLAVLINSLIVIPRALAAGSKATTKKDDNDGKTTSSFTTTSMAISGGDASTKSVTKTLHQTVVVFVTVMLVGAMGYIHCVINCV